MLPYAQSVASRGGMKMGLFDLFKPDVKAIKAKKDVEGLINALKEEEILHFHGYSSRGLIYLC